MQDALNAFFSSFAEDVPNFDAGLIAKRYHSPYVVMSASGDAWVCNEVAETIEYFQSLLDKHKSEGVVSCSFEALEWTAIGDHCVLASVAWTMSGSDGQAISNWRESYNMLSTEDGFKIFTSIDH